MSVVAGIDWVAWALLVGRVVVIFAGLLISVMLVIWIERKVVADMQVRVGTKTPEAVDRIQLAINRDNTDKARYYVGANVIPVNSLGTNPNFSQLFTIVTKVNHRQPDQYTRQPAGFTTPKRRATASPATALPGEDD